MVLSFATLLAVVLPGTGCSDGTSDGPAGSGGGAGTGPAAGGLAGAGSAGAGSASGGSASGGSTNGGSTNGGSAVASGGTAVSSSGGSGGGAPSGAHCSPGGVLTWPEEVYEMFGGPLATCMAYETSPDGVPDAPVLLVTNIDLPQTMVPGSPYAFSVVIGAAPDDGSVTIEFWGSDTKCGFGAEKLYTGPMTKGTLCVEFEPSASYEHVLMVWRGEGSLGHNNVAICPGGACE